MMSDFKELDSFTENVLQRTRNRKEKMKSNLARLATDYNQWEDESGSGAAIPTYRFDYSPEKKVTANKYASTPTRSPLKQVSSPNRSPLKQAINLPIKSSPKPPFICSSPQKKQPDPNLDCPSKCKDLIDKFAQEEVLNTKQIQMKEIIEEESPQIEDHQSPKKFFFPNVSPQKRDNKMPSPIKMVVSPVQPVEKKPSTSVEETGMSLKARIALFEKAKLNEQRPESPQPERLSVFEKKLLFENAMDKIEKPKNVKIPINEERQAHIETKKEVEIALAAFEEIDQYSTSSIESETTFFSKLSPRHFDVTGDSVAYEFPPPPSFVEPPEIIANDNAMFTSHSDFSSQSKNLPEHRDSFTSSQTSTPSTSGTDDDAKISNKSASKRIYPELPTYEEGNSLHTSPIKLSPQKNSVSPIKMYKPNEDDQFKEVKTTTPMRTLSMYRREQKLQTKTTPSTPSIIYTTPKFMLKEEEEDSEKIGNEIRKLETEVMQHKNVISQANQALILCLESPEFRGSLEQVEAEKHLLIATKKRSACLDEIHKLKMENASKTKKREAVKGTLALKTIKLPLKKKFLADLSEKKCQFEHYFLCLVRCGPKVIATQMLKSSNIEEGILSFDNLITFDKLNEKFQIYIEVYGMANCRENLPENVKHHLKKPTSKSMKLASSKSKAKKPQIQNPTLQTEKQLNFSMVGFVVIALNNCNKTNYELLNFVYNSPLEGFLDVNLNVKAEYKTTMKSYLNFQNENGFWNRRWAVLKGYCLALWKYYEDEEKKKPLGYIDLRECINPSVNSVPYDVCSRSNSFILITIRPSDQVEMDSNNRKYKKMVTTKHLISADESDEMVDWCTKLEETLKNLRLWESDSARAYEPSAFEKAMK